MASGLYARFGLAFLFVPLSAHAVSSDIALIDRCFHLRESTVLNHMQSCDDFRDRGTAKPALQGKQDCISRYWTTDSEGNPKHRKFGWFTFQNGVKQGPAELILDSYYLASSDRKKEITLKLQFDKDRLHGTVVIPDPDSSDRCEIPFEHGKVHGIIRLKTSGGKLLAAKSVDEAHEEKRNWQRPEPPVLEMAYCKSGKLSALNCGTHSETPEDAALCGFGAAAPTEVSLHACWGGDVTETFWVLDGKISKRRSKTDGGFFRDLFVGSRLPGQLTVLTSFERPAAFGEWPKSRKVEYFYPSGKPMLSVRLKDDAPAESLRLLSDDGKLMAEAKFVGNAEMSYYAEYFLNGQPKIIAKDEGKNTHIVETSPHDERLVADCMYTTYDPKTRLRCSYGDYSCHSQETKRIDLSKYGVHAAYEMVPLHCRVLRGGEEVRTRNYENGYLKAETELDRESNSRVVRTYDKGRLKGVKVLNLRSNKVIEEYDVLEDGSKVYRKKQSDPTPVSS